MSTLPRTALERPARALPQPNRGRADQRVLTVVRWPVGGIRTHVLYNYPDAVAEGYRFTFVGPADESFDTFAAGLEGLPGSEFVGVPVREGRCRMNGTVRRLLRSGRFALMHSHGLTAAMQAAAANLGLGLPHVATVHDPLRPDQFPGLRGWLKRQLMGRLLRRLDAAVCVGYDIRANLQEYLPALPGERLVIIPNGIDVERFATDVPAPDDLRLRLGLESGVTLIGFLGRFMVQKGFLPLLGAIERLVRERLPQRFHLVAVGSGDFEREYRAEIERRGLRDHVSMLGFVLDVRPLLRQLDLLAVPSLWEASPLLPMEAMAAGVPVLGTDCIGLREVLRDTPSRMVRAGNIDELYRGLSDSLKHPRAEAARAFAPAARARFDNRPSAQRLVELFDELASTATARQHDWKSKDRCLPRNQAAIIDPTTTFETPQCTGF
jgi:glycosyltransferase involved in cell wall biosynthesis